MAERIDARDRYFVHVRGRKFRVSRLMQQWWERVASTLLGGSVTSTIYAYRTSNEVFAQAGAHEFPKDAL